VVRYPCVGPVGILPAASSGRGITPAILKVGKPISVKVNPLFSRGKAGPGAPLAAHEASEGQRAAELHHARIL
jgi:hypothetical protein